MALGDEVLQSALAGSVGEKGFAQMQGKLTVPLTKNVLMALGGTQALHGGGEQGEIVCTDTVVLANSKGTGSLLPLRSLSQQAHIDAPPMALSAGIAQAHSSRGTETTT